MKRVSEVVTIDEVKSWNTGDIITIEAGTGAGKSYFIKNNLYALAKKDNKKILFLVHRSNCHTQFLQELRRDNKTDIIHIKTYQSLEQAYLKQREFSFAQYQYIVCDEFHYHMQDALFNKFTDISLNMILEQTDKTRIFMSATGGNMSNYIGKRGNDINSYAIPNKYDYIENLTFYNKDESMYKIIDQAVKENKKTVFFIQSAEKAFNLYNTYKEHCLFNCSKSNTKYYKHVDKDKINNMLYTERFEELILITTTCMDAGVNIVDKELKYIVTDVKDIGTLIQCVGRKRLQDKSDKIELYVKTLNNKQLGGMLSQAKRKQERALYLRKTSVHEYMIKYPRDYDKWNIVYNDFVPGESSLSTLKVNELVYCKCLADAHQIEVMLKEDYGYCKHIAKLFGYYDSDIGYQYNVLEEDYTRMKLEEYLDSIVGNQIHKSEQNQLIEMIDVKVNGRQQKSYKKLNEGLEMINMPFVIIPKRNTESRYWIIEKMAK